MLTHTNVPQAVPKRVVVVGARSFLGSLTLQCLERAGIEILGLSSRDLDLTEAESAQRLAAILRADDALIMFAALTPDKGRDVNAMIRNLRMAETVCRALDQQACAHVIYFSSDAVYPMTDEVIREESCAAPTDLYGCMHRSREILFQDRVRCPVAILRPTMVYGVGDTHNSYGPNRFRRTAAQEGKITIGGNGEETRDHVFVHDVVEIVRLCLMHRSSGVLNIATGQSVSFFDLAHLISDFFPEAAKVICTARTVPITHRSFDIGATNTAFPEFKFTPLAEGIRRVHMESSSL